MKKSFIMSSRIIWGGIVCMLAAFLLTATTAKAEDGPVTPFKKFTIVDTKTIDGCVVKWSGAADIYNKNNGVLQSVDIYTDEAMTTRPTEAQKLVVPETFTMDNDGSEYTFSVASVDTYCFNSNNNKNSFSEIDLPSSIKLSIPTTQAEVTKYATGTLGNYCFNADDDSPLKTIVFYAKDGVRYKARFHQSDLTAYFIYDSADQTKTLNISTHIVPQDFKLSNMPTTRLRASGVTAYGIPAGAFEGNQTLQNIQFVCYDATATLDIYSRAFSGCPKLTSVTLPDYAIKLNGYVFSGCENLTSVVIPATTHKVSTGQWIFANCPKLSTLRWGDNVVQLGDNSFSSTNIKSFIMPANMSSWGENCFANTDLKAVVITSTTLKQNDLIGFLNKILHEDVKVYFPVEKYDALNEHFAGITGNQKIPFIAYKNMSLNRTATLGTVCLPYAIDMANSYNVKGLYTISGPKDGDDTRLMLSAVADGNTEAGMPYIVERNDDSYDGNRMVVYACKSDAVKSDNIVSDEWLTGILTPAEGATYEEGDYIMQSDNMLHRVGASYKPAHTPYSAYIANGKISAEAKLSFAFDDTPTGIDNATADKQETKHLPMYNVAGQRIAAPVKGQLYIQGGKKHIQL